MDTTFTDDDLDRLERYLQAPERMENTLPADAIQGLLAAVVSAPAPIGPSAWLPLVLGEGHEFPSDAQAEEVTRLLMRFHNATAQQLNAADGFDFILYGEEGDEFEFEAWCEGYLMGVELADPPWDEVADEDEVEDMLFPFFVLSGRWKEAMEEAGEAAMPESEERSLAEEQAEGLADTVLANRRYWFEHNVPDTVRREAPKVGRNDPCPCGSGKKYKNCHGQ